MATGKRYRLPTEAEWEYAARSGSKDDIYAGTSEENQLPTYAVYNQRGTSPVGAKKPNGLGLYDMSGNVWEWVEDCLHGSYRGAPRDGSAWLDADGGDCSGRVLRGGSWLYLPLGGPPYVAPAQVPGRRPVQPHWFPSRPGHFRITLCPLFFDPLPFRNSPSPEL